MKVLVIAAHPDDEVLGMGGLLKKFSKKENDIKIVFLATGISSRRSNDYLNSTKYKINNNLKNDIEKQIEKLQKDARKALSVLGIKKIQFEDFPDNEMDTVSNLKITKKIEAIIDDYRPDTVYTHSQCDINVDHRLIYESTITATRPKKNSVVKQVISFETPSSTEWYFPQKFSPNIFVDISKELKFKLKAMQYYKNELMEFPHPRSIEALEIIAKRWGTVCGFNAAEAFCLVRSLVRNP
jgi:LmbE family N-acetylglucosaminyl deacetylase